MAGEKKKAEFERYIIAFVFEKKEEELAYVRRIRANVLKQLHDWSSLQRATLNWSQSLQ